MNDEEYVLIGSTLWNKIGDDENTYTELLKIFQQVGQESRGRICRDYFGIWYLLFMIKLIKLNVDTL